MGGVDFLKLIDEEVVSKVVVAVVRGGVWGPCRYGPASGENTSHLCRLRILDYFGLDPPKGGSGLVGNKLIGVARAHTTRVLEDVLNLDQS